MRTFGGVLIAASISVASLSAQEVPADEAPPLPSSVVGIFGGVASTTFVWRPETVQESVQGPLLLHERTQ